MSIIAKLILFTRGSVIWCQHMLTFALLYGKCSEMKKTNSWLICCVFTKKISELNVDFFYYYFFLVLVSFIKQLFPYCPINEIISNSGSFELYLHQFMNSIRWMLCWEMAFFCVGENSLGWMACVTNNFFRKRRVCCCCFLLFVLSPPQFWKATIKADHSACSSHKAWVSWLT